MLWRHKRDRKIRRSLSTRPAALFVRSLACGFLLATALALAAGVGGCALPAILAAKTVGPPKVPARYIPPKTPMLVMVENYNTGAGIDAQQLARYIETEITANKIAPLVDTDKLYRLRDADIDAYHQMSIQDIGKAVGAGQILYVNLITAAIDHPPGSDQVKGSVAVRVRVIDVNTGDTVWPRDARDGYAMAQETPYVPETSEAADMTIRQKLCQSMATEIGRLFYAWQPPDDTGEQDDMGQF
jgi:hypothetical protein